MMSPRYIPNILTSLRLLLIIPIQVALLQRDFTLAFYLFVIAGVTDGLDGLLARLYNWTSRFGAFIDPLADKLLLMSSFVVFTILGQFPSWLVIVAVARDIWIMFGTMVYRRLVGHVDFSPSGISKINTFLQILLVTLMLIHLSFTTIPASILHALMFGILLTSSLSFAHYTWAWGQLAIKNYRNKATL